MDNLALLIGIGAGGYYMWNEYQKKQSGSDATENEAGQTDITGAGTSVFSQASRTLAYRILRETHATVTDFDVLTDADLRGLMNTLGISPDALDLAVTPEQAETLLQSAREASRLVNEITIDQATRTQWNLVISASKKAEVTQWTATQNLSINSRFEAGRNPNAGLISYIHELRIAMIAPYLHPIDNVNVSGLHLDRAWFETVITNHCGHIDPVILNKIHEIWTPSDWTWYASTSYFGGLFDAIVTTAETSFTDGKQTAIDLLAVETASKNAIIDASDWVALGYKVSETGVIVEPTEDHHIA